MMVRNEPGVLAFRYSPTSGRVGPVRVRIPLLVATLFLTVAMAPAAERFERQQLGISVLVPEGWRTRYDAMEETLLLGSPDGLRLLFLFHEGGSKLDPEVVREQFKSDGRQLGQKVGKVKVVERPDRKGTIGGREAYAWILGFDGPGGAPAESRHWLAEGPSRKGGILRVQVQTAARVELLATHERTIGRLLATFGWPGAPIPEEPPTDTPVASAGPAAPPILSLVRDTPPSPAATVKPASEGATDDPAAALRRAAREVLTAESGYSMPVPEGHDADARAYDRGSLQGGVGFMREAREIQDPEKVRRLQEAFRVRADPARTEEEKRRAAAYLGFDPGN